MTTREAAFTFAALQEHYRAPHPLYDALRAFVWACNAHQAAPWWLDRERASAAIAAGVDVCQ